MAILKVPCPVGICEELRMRIRQSRWQEYDPAVVLTLVLGLAVGTVLVTAF